VLQNPNPDEPADKQSPKDQKAKVGHGPNGASRFTGAKRITVAHATLEAGDPCSECQKGKVYRQKNSKTLLRIRRLPPPEATAHELEQLRCSGCGQVFTAEAPARAFHRKPTIHLKSQTRPLTAPNDSRTPVFRVSHFHISSPVAWTHPIMSD